MTRDSLMQWGGAPVGFGTLMDAYAGAKRAIRFVDVSNGSDANSGKSPKNPFATIQHAIDDLRYIEGAVIYIAPGETTALSTDPTPYAETLIIYNDQPNMSLIGLNSGRTQGGLPEIKKGSGSTALIDIRAPGCMIANLGINGASSTGGGIKLTDDGGTAAVAFGTTIFNCHFKNNKCHATHASAGGAIYTSSNGGAWQLLVKGCRFYKNTGGIVVVGTGVSVPQDWIIEDNIFGGAASTDTDADIYVGGSGITGCSIRRNTFATVDVPQKASGDVGLYISLATGSTGAITENTFACTGKTFGATGNAAVVPTTVRMGRNYQENAIITRT